jgi:hypothetical protein
MLNWAELMGFTDWKPLAQLPWPTTMLSDGLRQISSNAFVFVVPYNRMLESDGDGPYITLLWWAQSPGAARRAADGILEADDGVDGELPPGELLIEGARSYGDLLTAVKRTCPSGSIESASYDTQGRFLHAQIWAANFKFYFRDQRTPADGLPFAISVSERRPTRQ